MTVTREDLIRKLSTESGYTMQDIRHLLNCMDTVVFNELSEVTPDEEVAVQILQGVKLVCEPIEERSRKNPKDQSDIVCSASCKVKTRISRDLKLKMAESYDSKYNKNG